MHPAARIPLGQRPLFPCLLTVFIALPALVLGLAGCGDPPATSEPPERAVSAQFGLTVNPADPGLQTTQQQPIASPATVTGGSEDLGLVAYVHKEAQTPSRLWVELYLVNRGAQPLKGVTVSVSGLVNAAGFFNFTDDPLTAALSPATLSVGAIAPEGIERLSLGLSPQTAGQPISLQLAVQGSTGRYTATSSAPLQLTADDKELWVAQPDADLLAVVDTAAAKTIDKVSVPGRPTSVAITSDGALVLATSARSNRVSVIDRATRSIVQTLEESDGIGREPRHVVLSADGQRAYVSAYVGDQVTALQRQGDRFSVVGRVAVGRRPVGMSLTPDGATLLVSHYLPRGKVTANHGWVTVIDSQALTVVREATLTDDGNVEESGCLTDLFHLSKDRAIELSAEGVPTQLAGLFLTPSGTEGWIPGLRVGGAIPIWEGDVQKVGLGPIQGRFAPGFTFFLNTRDARGASAMLHPGAIDLPDSPASLLRCLRPSLQIEAPTANTIMPGVQSSPAAAFPAAVTALSETGVARFIAFTRGGRRALIPSYVADEIMVYDAITKQPTSRRHFTLSGSNPVGIAVSKDGRRGYVAYENSLFVSVLDLSAYADPAALPGPSFVPYELKKLPGPPNSAFTQSSVIRYVDKVSELPPITEMGQVELLASDPLSPMQRRGRVLFSSSNPTKYPQLTVNREAACAACHPDGATDGSVWATMEGERRTVGLWGGVAGRGWLHQSASHQNADEFVRTIVAERLGGKMTSSEDFAALADYLAHGIAKLQPPRVDAALAERGRQLFQQNCVSCHAGDHYTSGRASGSDPLGGGDNAGPGLYDVGTTTDNAHAVLGPLFTAMLPPTAKQAFDLTRGDRQLGTGDPLQLQLSFRQRPDRARGQVKAPSLINVRDNVLFFHNGQFDQLADAVHYMNSRLMAGLSADDEKAIVEFLNTL